MRCTRFLITYRRESTGSLIQMVFVSFKRAEKARESDARQKTRENMPSDGWDATFDVIDIETMQKHVFARWEVPLMLKDEEIRYEANNL